MRASARGRLTVGIHGTSLSITTMRSASPSTAFCRGSFHWHPSQHGSVVGKFM
jgi:hypothetical protein